MIIVSAEHTSDKEYKLVPVGNHLACCYRIIDLGTQKVTWNGQSKLQRKIYFTWEVHSEDLEGNLTAMEDGSPLSVSKRYTMALSDQASLRKDLESWRGVPFTQEELNGFNLENILGKWCMVNIVHNKADNGKTYANISGVSSVPSMIKKAGLPNQHNKSVIFSIDSFNQQIFNDLPEWIKDLIKQSPEYKVREELSDLSTLESDVPF